MLTSDRELESFLAIIDPCRRWMMINSEFHKKNCSLLPRMGKFCKMIVDVRLSDDGEFRIADFVSLSQPKFPIIAFHS